MTTRRTFIPNMDPELYLRVKKGAGQNQTRLYKVVAWDDRGEPWVASSADLALRPAQSFRGGVQALVRRHANGKVCQCGPEGEE